MWFCRKKACHRVALLSLSSMKTGRRWSSRWQPLTRSSRANSSLQRCLPNQDDLILIVIVCFTEMPIAVVFNVTELLYYKLLSVLVWLCRSFRNWTGANMRSSLKMGIVRRHPPPFPLYTSLILICWSPWPSIYFGILDHWPVLGRKQVRSQIGECRRTTSRRSRRISTNANVASGSRYKHYLSYRYYDMSS